MNQDSSFPPMLPPSTELGALLFAFLPCLQETYRPLASFVYHLTELNSLKKIPAMPPLSGLSGIDALITDKNIMLHSLSFYGKMFRMPLLSTIATLLQGMQFYQAYKDILPGLFGDANTNGGTDLFSMLGGLSPDLFSSMFSGFSGGNPFGSTSTSSPNEDRPADTVSPTASEDAPAPDDSPLYDSLFSFLTPEQQKIYEQLMHTD